MYLYFGNSPAISLLKRKVEKGQSEHLIKIGHQS